MTALPGASFPEWLPRYLRGFEELLGVIELSDGFVLIPVEVPGPDIARVLADWLARRGLSVVTVEPRSAAEWKGLGEALLRIEKLAANGIAVVIGSQLANPEVLEGLRFVNQRRDSISRHLRRPLLWCGPVEFLDSTWNHAPDFWSVRAVEQQVTPANEEGSPLDALRGLLVNARAQGDARSEARLAVKLADDLESAGAFDESAVLVRDTLDRLRSDAVPVWAELAVRHARLLLNAGATGEAIAEATRLLEYDLPNAVVDDARLVLGDAHARVGKHGEALSEYRQALVCAVEAGDAAAEIRARIGVGTSLAEGGSRMQQAIVRQAMTDIDLALEKARSIGDAALEALALRAMARVSARLHDEGRSKELLEEARKRELPQYASEQAYDLVRSLGDLRERRASLLAMNKSTAEVDAEILQLRRKLREGGQLQAGDSLGNDRYVLLRRLGGGGFAIVWEAHDSRRDERVAVKVLYPNMARNETARERFFRGARVMSALSDESVVRVIEPYGEDGGFYYFVMELCEGGDFRQAVLEKRLSRERVLEIILIIAGALSRAHARGYVHRDVKPGNILIDNTGAPKLTDFDLVAGQDTTAGTRTGAMGTFLYAAPEMLSRAQDADERADVFSLGMTAIFGIFGEDLPIRALQRQDDFIARLDYSEAVKQVLSKAVEWERKERYPDAGIFAAALRQALSGSPTSATPPAKISAALAPEREGPVAGSVAEVVPSAGAGAKIRLLKPETSPSEREEAAPGSAAVIPSPPVARTAGAPPSFRPETESTPPESVRTDKLPIRDEVSSEEGPPPARSLFTQLTGGVLLAAAMVALVVLSHPRWFGLLTNSGAGGTLISYGGSVGEGGAQGSMTWTFSWDAGPFSSPGPHDAGGPAVPEDGGSREAGAPDGRCPEGTFPGRFKISCVERLPVTKADYERCVASGRCSRPSVVDDCRPAEKDEDPVRCVSWAEALGYCDWAGGSLPHSWDLWGLASSLARLPYEWSFDLGSAGGEGRVAVSKHTTEFVPAGTRAPNTGFRCDRAQPPGFIRLDP